MLKGTTTLVTGGASGLGRATAQRVVKKGGNVVICDLPESKGDAVAKMLGEDACVFVPVDVRKEDDVKNALITTKKKFGKLNHVVNCAGIGFVCPTYDFKKNIPHSLNDFKRVIEVNLTGTFNVIRLAVGAIVDNEPMENGQRGVIINTASIVAYDGTKGYTSYSASKGAVVAMTLPLARDLASYGIRVCAIAPGFFDTPIIDRIPKQQIPCIIKSIPFPKKIGDPSDFAMLVQSIIENPMLNGEVIRLDGALRPLF